MTRVATFLVSVIIIVQLTLLGSTILGGGAAEVFELNTPVNPPDDLAFPLDFEGFDPYAQSIALEWQSDAKLVRASMQIDWPAQVPAEQVGQLPRGGWLVLSYLSGIELLTMRADRGSGGIVEYAILPISPAEAESLRANPIDFSQATTRSGTVAIAAETAYGATFRAACPDNRPQSVVTPVRSAQSGAMVWNIEYLNRLEGQPSNSMSLDVDWNTGEMMNVENQSEPCG